MRKKDISNWGTGQDLNCLLFFAYLMDEITFSYTIDSYKAPTLNVKSLCIECLTVISDIKKDVINRGALNSVIEELVWAIEHDKIVSELICNSQTPLYIDELLTNNTIDRIKNAVVLIFNSVCKMYTDKIKERLTELIIENRRKEDIESITKLFVTDLLNMGYTNEYIYHTNQQFFFSSDGFIKDVNIINEYWNNFNGEKQKYKVVILGFTLFKELKTVIKPFDIKIENNFTFETSDSKLDKYIKKLATNKYYIIFDEITAIEPYHACNIAQQTIEQFSNLFSFYHHKTSLEWRKESIVMDVKNAKISIINKPTSRILCCKDLRPRKASSVLNNVIQNIDFEKKSMYRIMKSIDLHEAAITSESIENQFVNLFTAFEVLIPKSVSSGKDRIVQISDILVPFLCLDYYHKIIGYLTKSLIEWDEVLFKQILGEVSEGNGHKEKIAAFLCLKKYSDIRNTVYKKIVSEKYVLLQNRIYKLEKLFSSTENIITHLKVHEKRIKWHIDRIYRTRNLIVHAGNTPQYIDSLIENLHSYYDIMVKAIFEDNIKFKLNSLEHSYLTNELKYKEYKKVLNEYSHIELTEENFLKIIFNKFLPK